MIGKKNVLFVVRKDKDREKEGKFVRGRIKKDSMGTKRRERRLRKT